MRAAVHRGVAWRLVASAACASFFACSGGDGATATDSSPVTSASSIGAPVQLGGDVVARVGGRPIVGALVLSVARARRLSVSDARRTLVAEALLAADARTSGGERAQSVRQQIAAASARRLVEKYDDEARAIGPITDAELDEAIGDDWIDLARPETRVAVHALIRANMPDGEALASALHDALLLAQTREEFMARANAFPVPTPGAREVASIDVPFTRDGREASPYGGMLDAAFAEATFALPAVGATSAVVRTAFGWHVIRLVAILPPKQASREVRLQKLEGRVLAARLRGRFQAMVDEARKAAHIVTLAADADLMQPKLAVATPPVAP